MEIGSKVKYIHEDDDYRRSFGFYPAIGTIGRVVDVSDVMILVQWPKGTTKGKDEWWCEYTSVVCLDDAAVSQEEDSGSPAPIEKTEAP